MLIAKAEARFGGDIAGDAADLANVNGVKKVVNNLGTATQNAGKGYAYELKKAADLKRAGGDIQQMNRFETVTFTDAAGTVKSSRYDIDAYEVKNGVRYLNEFKDRNKLYATKEIKDQILKMRTAIDDYNLGDEARIWVKNGGSASQSLKDFARDKRVAIYDDAGVWLNPW